ncbi:RagB/SusD family nutrient uptake outer membrane protein [Flavobacterium sp. LS1R49]|uniref:RagB/SusD family nutrient uptake outer membrane protein n=1 Tax=Flavobacterium shii TaxID=2987687 RepID=A0A9X2ZC55_9FLAO|nr:RagB/SusD family nutrient uptake outer membrane protein [Flavobacterium shii]MCV9926610.1 RagB/SusD family nutrient uptake outer membrane protein [Flavobacterium shii]
MKTIYAKKKKHLNIVPAILFLGLVLSMSSCDSFVEVDLPKSQLTNVTVFQDYATANAAMADVYSKIRDKGVLTGSQFGISNYLGNYADELIFYGPPSNSALAFYTNLVLPSNSTIALFWNNSYNQIYAANAVFEGVGASTFNVEEKAQLQGEALFVRGLLHFYLLQLFGAIPYVQTTDYKANSVVKRMSSNEVYAQIISDLKTAETLLLPSYANTERVRPNSFVVKALLARVYLYKGAWDDANKMATAVIENNTLYVFENNLDKIFLKTATETIWQFMPTVAGKNTDEGAFFIFTSGPPPLVALSESLINSFAVNDLRKSRWTASVSKGSGIWYYAYKYKESKFTSASKEYSIVLRLTEQYLIRAEARAELENHIGAKQDLNKIRKRAGLSDIVTNSKEELLEAIQQERRKELFSEYGHRFFDLKRRGKLDAALSGKSGWNTTDSLLPIPESELSVNPNLGPQNPGY